MQDDRQNLPSASAWRRYELCNGSFQLEQEARRLGQAAHEDSPAARRGSLIHSFLAGELDEDGKPIELDEDEQRTADFLQQRSQDQVARLFGDTPWQQFDEKRLWFIRDGRKLASGKFDRCVYSDRLALVQDFKSGQSEPQSAEVSSQLKFLAVVVGLALPTVKEIVTQVVSVYYGISERRFFIEDLAEAYRDVSKTLRAIEAEDAPLIAGIEQCAYCPASLICQKVKDLILPIAKLQISALPDGVRGSKLLDEVAILEKHLKEIKKYYEKRCNADATYKLPGYKITADNEICEASEWGYELVPGNEVREIADWGKAEMRLAEYLDVDQLKEAQSYTLAKLEAALAKSLKLTTEQAKEKLNQILNGLIVKNQNKSSLKRVRGTSRLSEINLP